jgi:hypothetical protein
MKLRVLVLLAGVLAAAGTAAAQEPLLDRGFREMYDLRFEEAHQTFHAWEQAHPQDPMGPVGDAAAFLFSEFDRMLILQSEFFSTNAGFRDRRTLKPDPAVKAQLEQALERSRQLADAALAREPGNKNALFATILRLGMHSDYLALVEKRYLPALREMKAGRAMAEKLLAIDGTFYDAWLAIGLENYLLSIKPAPVRWFLRLGGAQIDKQQGLARLRLTAEKGRYLKPFARLLLAVAALRDNDRGLARELLADLNREYPHNRLYVQELARLN